MHVVLLETAGNQAFIFATNKLRENIGASELTYRAGTQYVLEAVQAAGGQALWSEDPAQLRAAICDPARNPPVAGGAPVEVIIATSGKALVLTRDAETARRIVAVATEQALRQAPGLDLCGVVVEFAHGQAAIHAAVATAYAELTAVRRQRPDPDLRSLALPIVARCSTSGWPASELDRDRREISRVGAAKRAMAAAWERRIARVLGDSGVRAAANLDQLEQHVEGGLEWLAVVHADGNRLGKIFLHFDQRCGSPDDHRYIEMLRHFSIALEEATEAAFATATRAMPPMAADGLDARAIVPLVLGGDDLTVLCDGKAALRFARTYLEAFEAATAHPARRDGIVRKVAGGGITACAGVAITKPHFPFSSGYDLAEQLLRSAKVAKQKAPGCSALDFHILFDSTFTDLDDIRRRLGPHGVRLTAKPYVVSESSRSWALAHHIGALTDRIAALRRPDPDDPQRRALPSSQLHDLREGLFAGRQEADSRLALIYPRYASKGLDALLEPAAPSLFRVGDDGVAETRFLDALEAAEFWSEDEA